MGRKVIVTSLVLIVPRNLPVSAPQGPTDRTTDADPGDRPRESALRISQDLSVAVPEGLEGEKMPVRAHLPGRMIDARAAAKTGL